MVQLLELLLARFRGPFSKFSGSACKILLHQWWTANLDLLWIDELIKHSSILREEIIKAAARADDIAEDGSTLVVSDWLEWSKLRLRKNKKGYLVKELNRWKDMQTRCFGTADGGLEDERMFIVHVILVMMAACYASVHTTTTVTCLLRVAFSSLFGCVPCVLLYNYSNSVMLNNVRKMNSIEVMEWASGFGNRSYSPKSLHFRLALPQNLLTWATFISIMHSYANDSRFLTSCLCILAVLNFAISLMLIYPYFKMPDAVEARSGRKSDEAAV